MSSKGDSTKSSIRMAAYKLFALKGFNAVTMKDICDETGLSRGGLYRHYSGTKQIFEEIFRQLSKESIEAYSSYIKKEMPIRIILNDIFEQLRNEMMDATNSLSLAIYEYSNSVNKDLFVELNEIGTEKWRALLQYGLDRKEIKDISVDQVVDAIVYSYQGVRMWSRVIPFSEEVGDHIINTWKELIFKGEVEHD